jgi:class 3 adenylate cyclase/tetratricopeptide (TPR) repeat protein
MSCATPLQVDRAVAREARKTVTVVFTDVADSTPLGERLDPEALRAVMGRYFDRMKSVIQRHGGSVEKFIGDAVMAVFGIPSLHEDDALRAVRAAAEMRDALDDLNRELQRDRGVTIQVRTGVNTGEVVAGDPAKGQTLATGGAINTAARLQQGAGPGDILLGPSTHRLVRDAVVVEPVAPMKLKGKAEPVQAVRLLEVVPGAGAVPRHLDSPMVGRERERQLLRLSFERAAEERVCHLATVLGSAGVGKSRLVEEFLAPLEDSVTLLRGRCLPYGEGITFWPVREVLRQAAGVGEEEPAEEARAKLRSLCQGIEGEDLVFDRVAQVLGLGGESGPSEETFWAIRRLLEIAGSDRPLVIVFDDIHWAEPTFLDFVEHLTDWTRDAALLVLCLSRQELLESRPAWGGGKMNASAILLEPLSEEQCAELIENLLGRAQLAGDVRSRVVEAAEGNPLFVEQMLSMLIDDELLRQEDGHWVASGDLTDLAVPPSTQALIAARLDRLGGEERAVMERAAVVGRVFYRDAVAELSPQGARPAVGTHLMTLVRRELIRPQASQFGETFRFRHILIRDAAYDSMPKELRADLHERFAGWLESRAGERLQEYEEVLGFHLERAYLYRSELGPVDGRSGALARRAGLVLGRAGRRAADRGDTPGAVKLLSRATSLLPEDDVERLRMLSDLAQALIDTARLSEAGDVIAEAIQRAVATGLPDAEIRARLVKTFHLLATDPSFSMARALREGQSLLERARQVGDLDLLARAQEVVGALLFWTGRSEASVDLLDQGIAEARARGAGDAERRLYRVLAGPFVWGAIPAGEGLARARALLPGTSGSTEADLRQVIGALLAMQGDIDAARAEIRRWDASLRELGGAMELATGHAAAHVEMIAGNPAGVAARIREGLDVLREAGETGFLSTSAAMLADALFAQGKYEEAEEFSRVSEENAAPDDVASQTGWRSARAKVLAHRGSFDEAEILAREAVAMSRRTDHLVMIGYSLADLAEVLRLAGKVEDARAAAEEAASVFDRKQDVVSAARMKELVRSLGGGSSG